MLVIKENIIENCSYFNFNTLMPRPKEIAYAFSPREVASITGISLHMLNYLCRMGYLHPHYVVPGVRGKVRYYSYRDLVVARIIQHLREAGVELARLKVAVQTLARDDTWLPKKMQEPNPLRWLVTDGKEVFVENDDGFIDELRPNGQRAFGFIISLANMQNEVKERIPPEKRSGYSMQNKPWSEPSAIGSKRRAQGSRD
jgi:DNA-binding transcriptional MerR regulator